MDSTSEHGRGLPSIWDFLSRDEERQCVANVIGMFRDPGPEHPVDAGEFLCHLDTMDLTARVWRRYRRPQQVRWDPEAMLRVVLYFGIMGYQHLTRAWRDLALRPELTHALGLDDVPPYKTLWHFVTVRLGLEGVHELFSRLVELVVSEGHARGLPIGETVSVDAMPIETGPRDQRAQYSPHYKVRGYKAHNVVDTVYGIPLDVKVTQMYVGESPELPGAVRRVKARGCSVREVVADTGYDSFENFGVVCQELGARFWMRFPKTAIIDPDGEAEHLSRLYERCWKDDAYEPRAPLERCLSFLYGRKPRWRELVGRYHRNEAFRLVLSDPLRWEREYHRRSFMENNQGYWKQHVGMTKVEGRPMHHVELRYVIRLVGVLASVLTRLQNGVRSGLSETVGIQ